MSEKPIISEAFKFWSSFALGFIAGLLLASILVAVFVK